MSEQEQCCNIFEKFEVDEGEIFANKHWVATIRPKQVTLGAVVLVARDHVESIGRCRGEALAALGEAAREIESGLTKAFNCDKINYLALMMKDPHLHFHVIPRYRSEIEFGGFLFLDEGWKGLPVLSPSSIPGREIVRQVRSELSDAIK